MRYILSFIFFFLSIFPLRILYFFGSIFFFFSFYFFRYRRSVVVQNLQHAFPQKSEIEIHQIAKSFFRHFFDLIMEMIKTLSVKKDFFKKRIQYRNIELLDNFAKKNQSIVVVLGHFNNWEWLLIGTSSLIQQDILGVYKDINTSFFDDIMLKARTRFGAKLVSMKDSYREIISKKDTTQIIGLIADQSPTLSSSNFYTTFFNQEVPVFLGPEKIAKKMNLPVVYCDMKKIRRGYYEVGFEVLESNARGAQDGEITNKFIKRLETQIKNQPENWLWSHRRWKHKR